MNKYGIKLGQAGTDAQQKKKAAATGQALLDVMQQESQHIKDEIAKRATERPGANYNQDSDKSSRTHSGRFGSDRNKSDQGSIEDVNLFGNYEQESALSFTSENTPAGANPKAANRRKGTPEKPRPEGESYANGENSMPRIYEASDSSSSSSESEDEDPAELDRKDDSL